MDEHTIFVISLIINLFVIPILIYYYITNEYLKDKIKRARGVMYEMRMYSLAEYSKVVKEYYFDILSEKLHDILGDDL